MMMGIRSLPAAMGRISFLSGISSKIPRPGVLLAETVRSKGLCSQRSQNIPDLDDLEESPIENPPPALPITVVSGFLGSGKTSLIKHLLSNMGEQRIGIVVNDLSELNVDAATIKGYVANPQEDVLPISGGCICCTMGGDLGDKVDELAEKRELDYLLVEGSGVSLPLPVAATLFDSAPEDGGLVRLDTLVTVVDSAIFLRDIVAGTDLTDRGMDEGQHDDRTVGDILVEQVEFADVIILNKLDLVSEGEKERVRLLVEELNPKAKIIEAVNCQVSSSDILNTKLFDPVAAMELPGWVQKINENSTSPKENGDGTKVKHKHDGISSFVYRAKRPFHPERLLDIALSKSWPGVLRSKGFIWLATRNNQMGLWQSAGPSWGCDAGSPWLAALKDNEIPDGIDKTSWDSNWGDRCTEIVWIGDSMDPTSIKAMLDECLLTTEEMKAGPAKWSQIPDELPSWPEQEWIWRP